MSKISVFLSHPLYLRAKLFSMDLNPVFFSPYVDLNKDNLYIVLSLFGVIDIVKKLKQVNENEISMAVVTTKVELEFFKSYNELFDVYTKLNIKKNKFSINSVHIDLLSKFYFINTEKIVNETSVTILNNKKSFINKVLKLMKGV
jgi:hypothetical protein